MKDGLDGAFKMGYTDKKDFWIRSFLMNFTEIAELRDSCRRYDAQKPVEPEKISAVLEAARLAPSACNGQPYHFTVCKGETAKKVAAAVSGMGLNRFASDAPVMIVISEEAYVPSAAMGANVTGNDYRSMDIGIAAAYITSEAAVQGLGSCILGWFNGKKVQEICETEGTVRLVITLGYARADHEHRPKKRKALSELVSEKE